MTFIFWTFFVSAIVTGMISRIPIGYGIRFPFIILSLIFSGGFISTGIFIMFRWALNVS